ncbi:MAG TPA: hypothetical protein VN366_01805 [Feifaniaceae bacterium]|nr:hypothetical protein [Feifaniaceae bacterium]
MDIVIGIIVAILFLVGSANKKKQEQAQREAKARTMEPPSDDPRFPSAPSMRKMPDFSGEASPGGEGEPARELPVRPVPVPQRAQAYEGGVQMQMPEGPETPNSAAGPVASVSARMEATQGRHATLSRGLEAHVHTEGSMESARPARRAVNAYETAEPEAPRGPALDVLTRLAHDPGAAAEGVLLSEILGKPKALRRV